MALFLQLGWFFREHRRTYGLALLMLAGVAVLNGRGIRVAKRAGRVRETPTE